VSRFPEVCGGKLPPRQPAGRRRYMFVALLLLSVAGSAQEPVKQARYIMGTVCEIIAYPGSGSSREQTEVAVNAAFDEIKRIDGTLSNWKASSDLMQLNAAAGAEGQPRPRVVVGRELFDRVVAALTIAQQTDGLFDPTVGPLMRYWGFLPGNSHSREKLAEVKRRVGWQKVHVDATTSAIWFDEPGMELDFGGIAKGYAADRAARELKKRAVSSALVSLGSSSITVIGVPPEADGWKLAIKDPRDGDSALAEVVLHDGESLATSGTYEHRKGKRSHLIDPRTGQAITVTASVTVISKSGEEADALTKPFILLGTAESGEAVQILKKYSGTAALVFVGSGKGLRASASDNIRTRVRYLQKAVAAD
jgi:thiamine biosynthesis lipoprotein